MIVKWIAEAVSGLIAGPVLNAAVDAYKSKLAAGNDRDRIAAELAGRELAVEQRERELNTQTLVAEQGRWYTAIIRPLLALPVIIYFWKVIVWDKVLGWGVTDPLTGMAAEWAGVIITAYVGGRSLEKVARIFRR